MNRKDFVLIGIVLAVAGITYFFFGRDVSGNKVRITLDGSEYGVYELDKDQEIMVESDEGYNKVIIKDGNVSIEDADCPDKYCVKQGKTDSKNKSLICLPHKLVVELEEDINSNSEDIDAISQ